MSADAGQGGGPQRLDAIETVFQVALVTLQRTLRGGRLVLIAALLLLPGVLAYAVGRDGSDREQERMLYHTLVFYHFGIAVPATALVLATAFPWPESDEGTLTYWFTAPVQRWAVHLGRTIAALVVGEAALTLSVVALALPLNPSGAVDVLGPARTALTATLLAFPAYLGIFTLLATITRRGMIGGLGLILVENSLAMFAGGNLGRLTMLVYVRSLLHPAASRAGRLILEQKTGVTEPAAASTAILVFASVAIVTLAAALVLVQVIEYRGKHAQPT